MRRQFSLFQSHLDLSHSYWKQLLQAGGWAIDATCGNGQDTLKLAQMVQKDSGVIGIDIQQQAIDNTRHLLELSLANEQLARVHLFLQSHETFPQLAQQYPIRLIVYNLGYLPKGDKQRTTLTRTTLQSVEQALLLVQAGGVISITCYPGHEEGSEEERALIKKFSNLPATDWNVCYHSFLNRRNSPSLLLLQKIF